jgi:hypothetical protein
LQAPAERAALAAPAGPAADAEKKICRRQKQMGSNMPQRVCATAAEWAAHDRQGQEGVEAFKRDIQNSGTNSPVGQ